MKWLANMIMGRRANRVFERIHKLLPEAGTIADIGSGTGHNAEVIRQRTQLAVSEFDVADLHWVGPAPQIMAMSDARIPADDHSFQSAMLLYVLHYPASPGQLLIEARRVTSGPVIVLQSTYSGRLAQNILRFREFFFGRFGFYLARSSGLVSAQKCPLGPTHFFTPETLLELFHSAGFEVGQRVSEASVFCKVTRDLFVLNRIDTHQNGEAA